MAINFLGTWEQKENKTGNTETKHILGNRERQNRGGFREQGNMAINFLVTWEQKENKTGNTETKHILGNRERQNRIITFREHGNTRKIFLGTRVRDFPPPPLLPSPPVPLPAPAGRPSLGITTVTSVAGY